MWGEKTVETYIPKNIAIPWVQVSKVLQRPPILSYASHALNNFKRINSKGEIRLSNIMRMQSFLGGMDEDWFVLVHIAIEGCAGEAIAGCVSLVNHANHEMYTELKTDFLDIQNGLSNVLATLKRMTEQCDPYIYYKRVRQFIFGWNNPALPNGVIYEGVENYPAQKFRGETGAQSSIIPLLDAALGVQFDPNTALSRHLEDLKNYMPIKHRMLINDVKKKSKVRKIIYGFKNAKTNGDLVLQYNNCIKSIHQMRSIHLNFANLFIASQAQNDDANPTNHGTGGTPFMKYLKDHCDKTLAHLV
eukprot:g14289.t1